jgi:hypothetical protein
MSDKPVEIAEDVIYAAICCLSERAQQALTRTVWKDGIEIDKPSSDARKFAEWIVKPYVEELAASEARVKELLEQQKMPAIVRCRSCGGAQIWQRINGEILVYHDCKDGKVVRKMLTDLEQENASLREQFEQQPKCSECSAPCTDADLVGNQIELGFPKYWCNRCIALHLTRDENTGLREQVERLKASVLNMLNVLNCLDVYNRYAAVRDDAREVLIAARALPAHPTKKEN